MSRFRSDLKIPILIVVASMIAVLVTLTIAMRHDRSSTGTVPTSNEQDPLSLVLAEYSQSVEAFVVAGRTPPGKFWSKWLHRIEVCMQSHPDDPLRQQGWAVLVSIHHQLERHSEGFELALIGLDEAVDPRDIAARCADVIAAHPFLLASNDPQLIRLADDRREDAYARLWALIAHQRDVRSPTPAEWMSPATRSCFANQVAILRSRGEHRKASELEMDLALAISLPDYRDHEGLHAGDHALNAILRGPTDLQDQLFGSFIEVMETTNPLREEPAFFVGALFASTSVDPIPSADRLLPFIATAQTAHQVFATAQLSHRLASHPDAEEGSLGRDRWREVAGEVLAVSEKSVLVPAHSALSDLLARSPSHPDLPGLFSDARTSALFLAVKLENGIKRDIAALIRQDGYGMGMLAENILR